MKLFSFLFLLLLLLGCKKNESLKNMTLTKIENLSFRRSYAGHEYLTDKQLDSLYMTNPVSLYEIKANVLTQLNKNKILIGKGLIVDSFKKNLHKRMLSEKIEINYSYDFKQSNSIDILIKKGNEKIKKHIDFDRKHLIGVNYVDLDKDNIEEIIILENFYIMNGDNFELSIYKLSQ